MRSIVDADDILRRMLEFDEVRNNPSHAGNELAHLRGTSQLVYNWGAEDDWVLAALCHNAYDLDRPESFHYREKLESIIGKEAENLVYLFCALEPSAMTKIQQELLIAEDCYARREVTLEKNEISAMVTLGLANWLEQRPRLPKEHKSRLQNEFIAVKRFLPQAAYLDFMRAYGLT